MVLPALKRGGYSYRKQVLVGSLPGGGKHKVDLVAEKSGDEFLISMRWQQSSGAAEQKVPFEIICLAEAIKETPSYKRGYVVLRGSRLDAQGIFRGEDSKALGRYGSGEGIFARSVCCPCQRGKDTDLTIEFNVSAHHRRHKTRFAKSL
jgi:hypothetical protein